jgi:hypothetical protein
LTEALASFDRGLALRPHDAQARTLRGMISLQMGDFKQGWREFEWRWVDDGGSALPWQPYPFWDGTSLQNMTILVQAEQSTSDQVMFASCLPEVIAKAARCLVVCDSKLATLFMRSFPTAAIHSSTVPFSGAPLGKVDVRIAAGSLPRYLRTAPESFPQHPGYLLPDAQMRQQYWSRLESLGPGLKVGIAWRGGKRTSEPTSTSLADWARVLKTPGVHFVSLQAGDCTAELREARSLLGVKIHAWPDVHGCGNLDPLSALISSLDLAITVPNLTAHLAGALGVECWNLLPHWCSWRWFLARDDSPWYPSMRLFRQSQPGNWPGVFDRLAQAIAVRSGTAIGA